MGLHGSWEYSIQRYGPVGCILHGADHLGQMGRSQCRPLEDQSLLPRNLSNPLPVSLCPLVLCSHIFSITLFFLVFFFFFGKNSPLPFPPFCSDLRRSSSIVTYSNWSLEAVNIRWLASEASDSGRAEAGVADATNPTSHILTELYMAETGVETGTSRLRVVWESRSHCLGPLTRQACHRPPPSWTEYWAAWRPRCIFWT